MRINRLFLLLFLLLLVSPTAIGQCAMCRASLESSGNVVKAEAVNDGIVYLMVFPYILVAVVGYVVYSMFRQKKVKTT
jgi:heme/copper-type cytochrome/quinol oxidase subunit 2